MTPKTDIKGFKQAYDNLPCKIQRVIRGELMESQNWGQATFYSRMRGESYIRESEVAGVEQAFLRYGLDAFTGEKIK